MDQSLSDVRSKICDTMLIAVSILAIPSFVLSLYQAHDAGCCSIMSLHACFVIFIWLTTLFRKRLPFIFRAGFVLVVATFVGIASIWILGFAAEPSFQLLVLAPIWSAFFFGVRSGYLWLLAITIAISLIAFITVTQNQPPTILLENFMTSPAAWGLAILAYVVLAGFVTYAHGSINKYLSESAQETKQFAEILQYITEGTSTSTGIEFFHQLNSSLAKYLVVDYAYIGKLSADKPDHMESISAWADGKVIENFSYDLKGTPCEFLLEQAACRYSNNVQKQFPMDLELEEWGIESYAGVRLVGDDGAPIGMLVVLGRQPMRNSKLIDQILTIFSIRATAELVRLETGGEIRQSNEQLEEAQSIAQLGSWNWDIVADKLTWSKEVYAILGVDEKVYTPTREKFLKLIHPDDAEHVAKAVEKSMEGVPISHEQRMVRPTGEIRCVHKRAKVIFDEFGKPLRMAGTIHDITERKRNELALHDSEEKYKAILENSTDVITVITLDYTFRYVSPSVLANYGYHQEELEGEGCFDLIHPDDVAKVKAILSNVAYQPGDSSSVTLRFRHKNGTWRTVLATGKNAMTTPGIEGVVVNNRDITAQGETERALNRSEQKYRELFEGSVASIVIFDKDRNFVDANPAGLELFGYSRKELLSLNITDVDDDTEAVRPKQEQVLSGQKIINFEHKVVRKDGKVVTVLNNSRPLLDNNDNLIGMQCTLIDISGLRDNEKKARQSQAILTAAVEVIGEGFVLYDEDDRLSFCNRKYLEIYAQSADLIVPGARFEDILRAGAERGQYKEAIGRVDEWVAERLFQHQNLDQFYEQELSDGRWVMLKEHKIPSGGTVGFRVDITELKQAKQDADEAQNRFKDYAETASDWFWETGPDFCYSNMRYDAGDSPSKHRDLVGNNHLEWVSSYKEPRDFAKHKAKLRDYQKFKNFEYLCVGIDGQIIFKQISGKPVFNELGAFLGYRGTGHDITEQKRIEQELQQFQKMDALGRMASGFAHDFNNALQPITLLSSAMLSELPPENALQKKMVIINDAVIQLEGLTKNILTFARREDAEKKYINISKTVTEALDLAARGLSPTTVLHRAVKTDTVLFYGNSAQIQTIVLNLISNAMDACEGKAGKINVSLNRITEYNNEEQKFSDSFKLEVSDNGSGISQEIKPHIFEPFYTTKSLGKGTGLGLSSVYANVISHDGRIEVQNRAEGGTIFEVVLPAGE